MNEQKRHETRRSKKLEPDHDKDVKIFSYASTNRNPISRAFTWGLACYGALGNAELVSPVRKEQRPRVAMNKPGRVSALEMAKIKDVACGCGFTVFAVKDNFGHLYGCGINNNGQFGYHAEIPGHPLQMLIVPVPIKLPVKDPSASVTKVECGQSHTLALTTTGQVFSMGSNAFGQCGRPVIENEDYFRSQVINTVHVPLEDPISDAIVDLECGINHSMFLSKMGQVYSCGWSSDGQTGLGHFDNQERPARLKGDIESEKIVKIACAADCVLALNGKSI